MLLQTRNRPTVARKNGWRCFATGFPSDTIAELNKVRDLISISALNISFCSYGFGVTDMNMYVCGLVICLMAAIKPFFFSFGVTDMKLTETEYDVYDLIDI